MNTYRHVVSVLGRSGMAALRCTAALGLALLVLAPAPAGAATTAPRNTTANATGANGVARPARPVGSVTVNGVTIVVTGDQQSPVEAGANAQGDLQALQATAAAAPGRSQAQQAAIHRRIQQAQRDAQTLTTMALPSGAQTGSITVTASASADGTTIAANPVAHRCALQQATQEVDTTRLNVEGDSC